MEAINASINQKDTPQQTNYATSLEAKFNPSTEDSHLHNYGQPVQPSDAKSASKLKTDCRAQQRASLQCIEENYENKDHACAQFFENYKKCRREEHERRLERNARGF